jgi:hypothetical protein
LEVLAAAATVEPFGVSHSTAIIAAPGGGIAVAAANAAVPAAATSIAGLIRTPLEAAATLVGAVMVLGAAPPGLAIENIGGSSRTAADKAQTRLPRPPSRQRLSYVPKHGFTTSVMRLLAGCKEHLPRPASFIGTMGKNPLTSIMVEDGSGGQPLYQVEVLHDEEGKSYLTEGWAQFFTDYGLERGWSLILTHRSRSPILCVRVVDGISCARTYSPRP